MSWWKRLWNRQTVEPPLADEVLPKEWPRLLGQHVPFYRRFLPAQRAALAQQVQTFLDEKEFWGSQDLEVTPEMKVVVAAYACLLVLKRPDLGLFPRTREVILYPSEFGEIIEAIGPDGRRYKIDLSKIGETWRGGPVLLAWDSVGGPYSENDNGHNTVLHEFAHALDYLDGAADGAPPLKTDEERATWKRVMTDEYQSLVAADQRGRRTFFDPYGAKNPAEFFAVVTEHFFEQPQRFRRNHRALYALLESFFNQDPASWRR
ncbi:MAG TPA: M90 family metallopeptidase [Phycisphaerae bacterium]|nr:M90 family metallopeptidase [Phycisphaerae bacterium]